LDCPPAQAQERVVNFYNWVELHGAGSAGGFTKETGIKVVYDTFDANETLETRLLAGKSGYDVVVPPRIFCSARSRRIFPETRQVEAAEPGQRVACGNPTPCDL